MANYYSDHPEIGFYLNHPLMARIVELKEKGFADAKEYDYAPVDLGDAIENYKQILDITGDVAANIIEPNSEAVDLEGPHLENGRMIYASKTYENLELQGCRPFRCRLPHSFIMPFGSSLEHGLRHYQYCQRYHQECVRRGHG